MSLAFLPLVAYLHLPTPEPEPVEMTKLEKAEAKRERKGRHLACIAQRGGFSQTATKGFTGYTISHVSCQNFYAWKQSRITRIQSPGICLGCMELR